MKKLFPEDSAPLVAGSSSPRLGQNMLGHMCSAIPIFDPVAEGYHDDNYINIQKGDDVTLLNEDPDGWAYGSVQGNCGWFPRQFVELKDVSLHAMVDYSSHVGNVPELWKDETTAMLCSRGPKALTLVSPMQAMLCSSAQCSHAHAL